MSMKFQLACLASGLLGAVLFAPAVMAQGRGGTFFTPPARTGGTFFSSPIANGFKQMPGRARFHGRFARIPRRHLVYPYAAYSPYFYYPDYDYDDGVPEEAPPPAPRSAASSPAPEPHQAADSVVMELRGDRWVRLTTTGPVEIAGQVSTSSAGSAVLPAFGQAPAAAPLPAAVLVFRDGRQEETVNYTIVGNALYLKGDFYTSGSWTRKILITDLDIPATLKINNQRGTKFALPSRPSEVILRP
jgi:hypothetical protein